MMHGQKKHQVTGVGRFYSYESWTRTSQLRSKDWFLPTHGVM